MDAGRPEAYGMLEDGALALDAAGDITWVGARADMPRSYLGVETVVYDAGGALITPGLIDCHTHLVYAGNRAREFELRLGGAHYAEIARAGGGILSTVRATRAAATSLAALSEARFAALTGSGVTTVEIKSGYGLDRDTELAMLRAARALGVRHGVDVRTTYLGLHAQPPEFAGERYVDFVIEEMLPAVAREKLANAVDAFCETIAFSSAQIARYFDAARALGFGIKLHADQLSDGGGAALAANFGASSADHLEHASPSGLAALAAAGTVAVLLPGATYFLRETAHPPIVDMRRLGIPFAIATDCNPGTSPLVSMPLALNLACTIFRITPEEALAGATRNAARALGLEHRIGTLSAGRRADFVVWDAEKPAELAYAIGANPARTIVRRGRAASQTV
ncbi:MAG: imidazolonepropionase [Candidatus Eremiobacteraeota bacterium]|nr:imidazolonepropionase [Candidatus Eremiobacteraeota bacterium]